MPGIGMIFYDYWWPIGYESIPIDTIFSGMNIHLPAILMWTTGVQGFDPSPIFGRFMDIMELSMATSCRDLALRYELRVAYRIELDNTSL